MRILVVCTANICRSPMAEHLLRREAAERGATVQIVSAGLLAAGQPAARGSRRALSPLGLSLDGHRSRRIDAALIAGADLVIGMEVRHIREAAVLVPDRFGSMFTLRELVSRAHAVGPRRDRPLAEWLAEVGEGRRASELMAATDLDIDDPYGGPEDGYTRTVTDLVALTEELADLLWGPASE